MEKLNFRIVIDAPREQVWKSLWNDATYREWTSVFSEGSRVETDWQKGSKVLFLGASDEGMVSRVEENIPNQFMSIKHLGVIKNGIEDMHSKEAREWTGSLENYTLTTVNGKTELTVDIDITDEYQDHFEKTWPKALEKIRSIAEKDMASAVTNL